jgi:hypothetical protein
VGKTRRKKPGDEFYRHSEHYEDDIDDYGIEEDYDEEIIDEVNEKTEE